MGASIDNMLVFVKFGTLYCLLCTVSGMRPADKRDGAGSHNWGTVVDDME